MDNSQGNKGTRKSEDCFHQNPSCIREGKKNTVFAHVLAGIFS